MHYIIIAQCTYRNTEFLDNLFSDIANSVQMKQMMHQIIQSNTAQKIIACH